MDSFGYKYLVAIRCMTFLHANYITDALNGFCMQQTEFPYVCMVVDDASTDGEQNVIREYIAEHFVVTETREIADGLGEYVIAKHKINANCDLVYVELSQNLYRERERKLSLIRFWQEMAKYEALCEGDDYWTDPYKLQKQVDFMEAHPKCSVSFHRCKHLNTYMNKWSDDGLEKYIINNKPTEISIPQFFKHWCTQPLTMMYRRSSYDTSIRTKYNHFWDMYFIYHLLCAGKGYLLPFVGGVHIIQANGMSGGLQSEVQRCEFELISADELHAVNHNKYTKKYWQDTVIWSWNTFEHSGEKQKLRSFILKEWHMFPWDMTEVMWIQTKRKIKSWLKK